MSLIFSFHFPMMWGVLVPVLFIFGKRTGRKFNIIGMCSGVAYIVSLFIIPVLENKHEGEFLYEFLEGVAENKFNIDPTPTQFGLLKMLSDLAHYFTIEGVTPFIIITILTLVVVVLYFSMVLLRRDGGQIVTGALLAILTIFMLVYDKLLTDKFPAQLAGYSVSWMTIIMLMFAVVPMITAICFREKK